MPLTWLSNKIFSGQPPKPPPRAPKTPYNLSGFPNEYIYILSRLVCNVPRNASCDSGNTVLWDLSGTNRTKFGKTFFLGSNISNFSLLTEVDNWQASLHNQWIPPGYVVAGTPGYSWRGFWPYLVFYDCIVMYCATRLLYGLHIHIYSKIIAGIFFLRFLSTTGVIIHGRNWFYREWLGGNGFFRGEAKGICYFQ